MSLPSIVGELLLGWLLADLVTGIFHWWEDRFGNPEWPLIGPWIIAPNQLHHAEPLRFLEHGFWGRNGASIVAAGIIGAGLLAALGPSVWLATLVLGGAMSNEVHRFAHAPSQAPSWVRALQQTGLLQGAKTHAGHHRPPQTANYCVLTEWLNPVLEGAGVWRKLERLFR